MNIRALIIDDEPHAREGIRIRLQEFTNIEILGECSSGTEAVEAINYLKPDLIFLDIQMPEMNGMEVLQKISVSPLPLVIFVTAFDKYALKAFDYHALDYLLKPINDNRFRETIQLAVSEINHRNLESYASKLRSMVTDYFNISNGSFEEPKIDFVIDKKNYLTRLMIKSRDNVSIISVNDIDWLESARDYVYVHTTSHKYIIRDTLHSLEQKFDPQKFTRIHRSAIVNIDKIKNLRANEHGDFDVFLYNGVKLKLSRTYRNHFQNVMGNTF